jgi:hypothetical protein
MKIILSISLTVVVLMFHLTAQSQSIERSVISNAGKSVSAPGIQVDYTLGELAISTLGANGISLTQGFHQPQSSFCLGDFNHDGLINLPDLLLMLSEYGCLSNCGTDLSNDGQVTIDDLLSFLSMFGNVCD